jgi:hypothetical protein
MTASLAPTAPTRHSLAAAPTAPTAAAPATTAVVDLSSLAGSITASADPAAFLSQLVLAVASSSTSAARQGQVLSGVKRTCDSMLKAVRSALLSAVDEQPGHYDGFTVSAKAGSRSLDYGRLQTEYPDAYGDLVKVGAPSLTVTYTG